MAFAAAYIHLARSRSYCASNTPCRVRLDRHAAYGGKRRDAACLHMWGIQLPERSGPNPDPVVEVRHKGWNYAALSGTKGRLLSLCTNEEDDSPGLVVNPGENLLRAYGADDSARLRRGRCLQILLGGEPSRAYGADDDARLRRGSGRKMIGINEGVKELPLS